MTARRSLLAVVMVVALLGGPLALPAAAAPISITSCTIIDQPGSYRLEQNVYSNPGTCFYIWSDFVTLDFDGYSILGIGTIGIDASGRRGVVIKNGMIRDFSTGILANWMSGGITIERMVLKNNGTGASVTNAVIRDSHFLDNTYSGLTLGSGSLVTGNTFAGNMFGIMGGDGSTLSGNVLSQNAYGLWMFNGYPPGGSTVVSNTVIGHWGAGMLVTCPSNVIGNTLTGNNGNLFLQGGDCNSVNNVAP